MTWASVVDVSGAYKPGIRKWMIAARELIFRLPGSASETYQWAVASQCVDRRVIRFTNDTD